MSSAATTGATSTLDVDRFLKAQAGSNWLTGQTWMNGFAQISVDVHQVEVCQLPPNVNP